MRDFSAATIHVLAGKGITIIGLMALPTGRFAGSDWDRGYIVADRGTCRVITHADLLALANRETR
jgi:hypothetical protein